MLISAQLIEVGSSLTSCIYLFWYSVRTELLLLKSERSPLLCHCKSALKIKITARVSLLSKKLLLLKAYVCIQRKLGIQLTFRYANTRQTQRCSIFNPYCVCNNKFQLKRKFLGIKSLFIRMITCLFHTQADTLFISGSNFKLA